MYKFVLIKQSIQPPEMDSNTQDQFIQKKLLYKFEKKLDLIEQEYLKQIYPSAEAQRKLSQEQLIREIGNLQFINFKYKAALLSSNKDLINNEEEMLDHDSKIVETKKEIKALEEQLQRAAIIKQNKRKFNEVGKEFMKFDKQADVDKKFGAIQEEIRQLDEKYQNDMKVYQMRQRYLKASLSALQTFFHDIEKRKQTQTYPLHFRTEVPEVGEDDDGQIY